MLILALLLAAPQPPQALLDYTIRLVGRFAVAHACPVSPTRAWTNAHVIDLRPFDPDVSLFPYAWSDGVGGEGYLYPVKAGTARDIGMTSLDGMEFRGWFKQADKPPVAGERLWLLGYDWENPKEAMSEEVVRVRVTRVIAGHVFFIPDGKHKPQGGSSGSCVLNDSGEVVAINEGGFHTENTDLVNSGAGVWGMWGKFE